jgi:hypothetical protein
MTLFRGEFPNTSCGVRGRLHAMTIMARSPRSTPISARSRSMISQVRSSHLRASSELKNFKQSKTGDRVTVGVEAMRRFSCDLGE